MFAGFGWNPDEIGAEWRCGETLRRRIGCPPDHKGNSHLVGVTPRLRLRPLSAEVGHRARAGAEAVIEPVRAAPPDDPLLLSGDVGRRREQLGSCLELLVRGLHEGTPDLRRQRAARHRFATELGQHRLELVGVADPDSDGELRRVPHEPGVTVVVRCSSLACNRPIDECRALARSLRDNTLQDRREQVGFVHRHRLAGNRAILEHLARTGELNLLDDTRAISGQRAVDAEATVCERCIGARHVERIHCDRAEANREVRIEFAADPEVVGRLDDRLRGDELRQLGVDGIVRRDHCPRQVNAPEVGPFVVRHAPDTIAGVDADRLRLEGCGR